MRANCGYFDDSQPKDSVSSFRWFHWGDFKNLNEPGIESQWRKILEASRGPSEGNLVDLIKVVLERFFASWYPVRHQFFISLTQVFRRRVRIQFLFNSYSVFTQSYSSFFLSINFSVSFFASSSLNCYILDHRSHVDYLVFKYFIDHYSSRSNSLISL